MYKIYDLSNVVTGMFVSLDLLAAIVLMIHYVKLKRSGCTVPTLWLAGFALVLDLVAEVLRVVQGIYLSESAFFDYAFPLFDLAITATFIFAGLSLITAKFPSHKSLLYIVGSAACVYSIYVIVHNIWLFSVLTVVWLLVLIIVVVRKVRRYNHALTFYYSNVDEHRTTWFVYILLWAFGLYPIYKLFAAGVGHAELIHIIYMLLAMLMYAVVTYKIVNQTMHDSNKVNSLLEEYAKEESGVSEEVVAEGRLRADDYFSAEEQAQMRLKLEHLMVEEQLYRSPDLCVNDLVDRLDTNPSYFYYFMRDVMKSSFLDYVNSYRVEESKSMLQRGEKIDYIVSRVGFNSDTTFRRAFKRVTGQPPSEWRAQNVKREVI